MNLKDSPEFTVKLLSDSGTFFQSTGHSPLQPVRTHSTAYPLLALALGCQERSKDPFIQSSSGTDSWESTGKEIT